MKQKSWHLNRRELLKGGGIALALPFLNSMSRAMGVSGAVAALAVRALPADGHTKILRIDHAGAVVERA